MQGRKIKAERDSIMDINIPQRVKILKVFVTDDSPAFVIKPGEIAEYFARNHCYVFDSRPSSPANPNSVQIVPRAAMWRVLRAIDAGTAEEIKEG